MSNFPSVNPLWDFNLPADSLATLPDDDFLAILHSQIAEAGNNNLPNQGFQSYYLPQQPVPQQNKVSNQVLPGNTSPPLSDSTPSPPSGFESNNPEDSGPSRNDSDLNGWIASNADDARKRKASFAHELGDGERIPPSQRSHMEEQNSLPKAPSRRKSSGNPAADEQRLLKRKEQNRAAQRAFRERKEKHVKDLEDQLSAMAARNDSTQAENDNLREMLRRLQAENTLLKQAAFTFSVPSGASINAKESNSAKSPVSGTPSPNGPSSQSAESALLTTSSTPRDPQESSTDNMRGDQPEQTSFGGNLDWMSLNAGPAGAVPSPFTIISSNPTYMSYRDPAPSAAPFTSFMNSYSLSPSRDGSLQSFTPQQQAYQNFLTPEVMMTDFNLGSSSLDSANYTFASNGNENNRFGELYSTQPTVGEQLIANFGCDTTTNNHSPANERSATTERCPKEGIAQEIAKRGLSSFAPADGSDTIKERLGLAGQVLPPIAKSDSNIDAEAAYNTIRSHPHFKDLDINSLCQEFAQKARCDGTRVVLAPSGMQELVDSLHARTT